MATIALYASQISSMSGLIQKVKKSVTDYKSELSALRTNSQQINQCICDLSSVVSLIQASSQTQDQKIASLDMLNQNLEQFAESAVRVDEEVADTVRQRKDDFYEKYNYLKPECEKNGWEKFCDGCATAAEWCKEHWKLIATIIIVIAAVVVIVFFPAAAPFLLLAAKGAIIGAISGGLLGGVTSLLSGGSFLEGFEEGAFSGAISGAIFGGLGGAGQMFGGSCKIINALGGTEKVFKVISCTAKVSGGITMVMGGFDTLAMGIGLFDPSNPLVVLNQKLHSSSLYNAFQFSAAAAAAFSGGAYLRMRQGPPACFLAGTLILTASGLVAIENIKAGDIVISTNVVNMKRGFKKVLRTFVNESKELVHIVVNGEKISATLNHMFYDVNKGWIPAVHLVQGSILLLSNNDSVEVDEVLLEKFDTPIKVYNFEVDEWHTYHVGNISVLVHNDCVIEISRSKYPESAKHIEEAIAEGKPDTLTIDRAGSGTRRRQSLKGIKKVAGCDLDEYPPAMFLEGGLQADGTRASVKPILSSDNRGSGAFFGNLLRGQEDGAKVTFKVVE
ncbi:MAG: polymorphic toxin-type HINT domain-containing protein [Clostridium sp.]|nr:polymorphic toxin-type HINT domain-containing protein [Clostridium sp.]